MHLNWASNDGKIQIHRGGACRSKARWGRRKHRQEGRMDRAEPGSVSRGAVGEQAQEASNARLRCLPLIR